MDSRLDWLPKLALKRLDGEAPAGVLVASVPVPPGAGRWGLEDLPTHLEKLGQWPGRGGPRRLLLMAEAPGGRAPATLSLKAAGKPGGPLPEAAAVLFATCPEENFAWDRHYLRLSWGGRSIGLAMGMSVGNDVHWWEGCRLIVRQESPHCRVVEMGGVIPRDLFGAADVERWPSHDNPYLHKHNWLNGLLRVRLFGNGVCEIVAHHINTRYVDDGAALEDCVPVIGFCELAGETSPGIGPFPGGQAVWQLGEVALDMTDPARLATPEEPGRLFLDDRFLVYQPYLGVSLYSGIFGEQRLGNPWLYRAEQRIVPRGLARTLRFSLSLNPERAPRIARYLAPAWWHGVCQEITPHALLPAANEFDEIEDRCRAWCRQFIVNGGFEDGCLPRAARADKGGPRYETSWEGELPAALISAAWLSGDAEDYRVALRAARYFTDVAVDHAAKLVRMHGYSPPAVSLPMQRIHACLAAYLETGELFQLETARAVIDNAFILHRNSWPRLATGRDACFIRGAVLLYRFLGDEHYLRLAREGIDDVIATQQPDGSFRDQGGGTGIHGWGAYITKPWMNCMAVGGMIDYLELFPDDEPVLRSVRRLADWLMAERWFHHGVRGWSYKHYCKGQRRQYSPREGGELTLPTPDLWHSNYLARILPYATIRTGDAGYGEALLESHYGALALGKGGGGGDHGCAQSLQYLPWLQTMLWRARLDEGGVSIDPLYLGSQTPAEATVRGPAGDIRVRWEAGRASVVSGQATVRVSG